MGQHTVVVYDSLPEFGLHRESVLALDPISLFEALWRIGDVKPKNERRVDNRCGCGSGEATLADCGSYTLKLVCRGREGVLGGNEFDTEPIITGLRWGSFGGTVGGGPLFAPFLYGDQYIEFLAGGVAGKLTYGRSFGDLAATMVKSTENEDFGTAPG